MAFGMNQRTLSLLIAATLLFLATPALAKSYDVEIIIFERSGGGTEQWPDNPGRPELHEARLLKPGPGTEAFTVLPKSRWRLRKEATRLRAKGLTPLVHLAWRHPAEPRKKSRPIQVQSASGNLDGTVKISVERYLHINLDLLLNGRYRFTGHRRMRSGETHYIDHPMMGALVLVSPLED
jgi:hypothetical protein